MDSMRKRMNLVSSSGRVIIGGAIALGVMVAPASAYLGLGPNTTFEHDAGGGTHLWPPTIHTVQEEQVPPGEDPPVQSTWTPEEFKLPALRFELIDNFDSVDSSVYELVSERPSQRDVSFDLDVAGNGSSVQDGGFAYGVPAPGVLGVLGIAALIGRRRRR